MSPYLKENRLQDVIAAIQVMGAYDEYSSRKADLWSAQLGVPQSGEDWFEVCREHPEFFRTNTTEDGGDDATWVGIRWRWATGRVYSPDAGRNLTPDEISSLPAVDKKKLTRAPLTSSQIETLIASAIQLHSRAIEHKRELRWWAIPAISAATAFVGAVLGAFARSYFQ
ncbi:hypothetical protein ABVF61_27810 [Roseibium sp. HPY-6]|uniref:hypothetical protein n=1 Tax=Roseibium sp. HPY-6 TaxID=3229852 RepID=UPI00338E7CEF